MVSQDPLAHLVFQAFQGKLVGCTLSTAMPFLYMFADEMVWPVDQVKSVGQEKLVKVESPDIQDPRDLSENSVRLAILALVFVKISIK